MIEKIIDFLKIFLGKYFLPTLVAIVLSFLTYYKTDSDNSFLAKFGLIGFGVFIFVVWFLIVCSTQLFVNKVKTIINLRKTSVENQQYNERKKQEKNRKALEYYWTEVDKMKNQDYQLLMDFIVSNNKPYFAGATFSDGCLLGSDWVHKTMIEVEQERKRVLRYQYILKDEIYKALNYSMITYGRISHFENK